MMNGFTNFQMSLIESVNLELRTRNLDDAVEYVSLDNKVSFSYVKDTYLSYRVMEIRTR